jgi:acyl-CoA thioester hydrolase
MAHQVDVTRGDYAIFYPISSRCQDNDAFGRINSATYYAYFETATNHFLMQHCQLDLYREELIGLVVSSGCEYISSIAFPDKLEVGLRIDRLGRSSVQYSAAIFKEKQVQASAFGHFVQVFVNRLADKPVDIPEPMRAKLSKIVFAADD